MTMLEKGLKSYLRTKAIFYNREFPEQYNRYLEKYRLITHQLGYKLLFCLNRKDLFANAGYGKMPIRVSFEWASRLLYEGNRTIVENAFLVTLGHELTHKKYDMFPLCYIKNKKFIAWINEVHADFGAAELMLQGDREKLIQSMEYN